MTEAEWLTCEKPSVMLEFLAGHVGARKLGLWACNCCHRFRHLLCDPRAATTLAVVERFLDGKATTAELAALHPTIRDAAQNAWGDRYYAEADANFTLHSAYSAAIATERAVYAVAAVFDDTARIAPPTLNWGYDSNQPTNEHLVRAALAWADATILMAPQHPRRRSLGRLVDSRVSRWEWQRQAVLLRDIAGNPFRPVAFDPGWRTSTAVALARGMYESRDFGAMPILADALQDAGCDSAEVLDHCRGPGPHVRGCWVVDLVLGKE